MLTYETRQAIREAWSAVQLVRLADYRRRAGIVVCAGCGQDLAEVSPGCGTCLERERGRRRRQVASSPVEE